MFHANYSYIMELEGCKNDTDYSNCLTNNVKRLCNTPECNNEVSENNLCAIHNKIPCVESGL